MADTLTSQSAPEGLLQARGARRALAGFFVSGLLLSFTGAILPAWGYHLTAGYGVIALYFLFLTGGILISIWTALWLLPRRGISFVLTLACSIACGAILFLASVPPPASPWWRMLGLFALGASAGLLQSGAFEAISPLYRHDPAATVNLGGTLLGGGCLSMALLVAGTYYIYTVPSILIWTSVIPGFFAISYSKVRYGAPPPRHRVSVIEGLRQFRSPVAVLFALLLFFQFGSEWSLAGWLPLFLVQRLGISPAQSLQLLALYWVALMAGRLVAQSVLPRVNRAKVLLLCAVGALFGATVLEFTNNRFGAVTGILFLGAAFAPIYPIVVEKIGYRFPYYHPGLFNGIFSFATMGALLAPCSIGVFARFWGVRVLMGLPAAGTMMVLILVLAIWVEARISAQKSRRVAAP